MKSKISALVAALLTLVLAALAAGCGSSSPSEHSADPSKGSPSVSGNPTDRAFVADMVPHHRSAVEMAAIAKTEASSPFVKKLSANITSSQKAEIAQMKRVDARLAKAGVKMGHLGMSHSMKGMDMEAHELRGAKPFDAKFIAMMVPHHEGAIAMAREELSKGKNAELEKLARDIIAAQRREVKEMRAHLKGTSGPEIDHQMHEGH